MGPRLRVEALCAGAQLRVQQGSPDEYYYNPLKCPLPDAPSLQMFCLYGTGIPTERSYYYLNMESNKVRPSCPIPASRCMCSSKWGCACERPHRHAERLANGIDGGAESGSLVSACQYGGS